MKCYECPINPEGHNICFNGDTNLDVTGDEKECGDDQVCLYQDIKTDQADGSLKTNFITRSCLNDVQVPQDHPLGQCKTKQIENTSTYTKTCYCKADLCNENHKTVSVSTTISTITTTISTTSTNKSCGYKYIRFGGFEL